MVADKAAHFSLVCQFSLVIGRLRKAMEELGAEGVMAIWMADAREIVPESWLGRLLVAFGINAKAIKRVSSW